jgi:hypothetical protein
VWDPGSEFGRFGVDDDDDDDQKWWGPGLGLGLRLGLGLEPPDQRLASEISVSHFLWSRASRHKQVVEYYIYISFNLRKSSSFYFFYLFQKIQNQLVYLI